METGADKIIIAVMLINHIDQHFRSYISLKKSIIFLAFIVHLINQQYKYEEYYEGKGVDDWNDKCWEKEINTHDIMVMTPPSYFRCIKKGIH